MKSKGRFQRILNIFHPSDPVAYRYHHRMLGYVRSDLDGSLIEILPHWIATQELAL